MTAPSVYVVDDDAAVRDGIVLLCEAAGLPVETFASAELFLDACYPDMTGCLLVDVRMPGMSGPQLQEELLRRGISLPIIFLTAHLDIPTTVATIKAGAVDYLTKPVNGRLLVEHVNSAIAHGLEIRERERKQHTLRERLASLTEREREVMMLAIAGHSNKEIARILGISHRTVELHRARVMHKTGAAHIIDLARMVDACGGEIAGKSNHV